MLSNKPLLKCTYDWSDDFRHITGTTEFYVTTCLCFCFGFRANILQLELALSEVSEKSTINPLDALD